MGSAGESTKYLEPGHGAHHQQTNPSSQTPKGACEEKLASAYYGLTTKEALIRLHNDMSQEVERMKVEFSKRKFISWLVESISFKSELSKMRWPSVLFMTGQAIAHFIVAFVLEVDNPATDWVGFQGFLLTALLIFNLTVNLWDTKLRFKELLMKSEQILQLIKECSSDKHLIKQWKLFSWQSAQAKSLFVPKSPCVHQTITYRDESCLNLPDYLLVKGDIIHLYPGERAPGECVSLSEENSHETEREKIFLHEGQIYHVACKKQNKDLKDNSINDQDDQLEDVSSNDDARKSLMVQFGHAKLKRSNKGADFLMLSTPYINSLRISLQRSHKRPVNSVEKECFIISRKYFETFVIPSVFLLSTIVTAIHYGYLDLTDSDQKIKTISIAYLLLRPSLTIMPFLPWMFPCFWLAVNAYGSAKLLCCAEAQREKTLDAGQNNQQATQENLVPSKFENLLATPTAAGSSENKHDEDDLHELRNNIKFRKVFKVFMDLVRGKGGHVWRSSSLLQVLGCLTSLCCIDKVGILSWSNPTPEKVFVMTKNNQTEESNRFINQPTHNLTDEHTDTVDGDGNSNSNKPTLLTIDGDDVIDEDTVKNTLSVIHDDQNSNNQTNLHHKHGLTSQCRPEILDLSHSLNCFRSSNIETIMSQPQGRLQFDDLNWKKYLSNLKPLGLAILMNNCCEKSFGDYFRFYKHISYESILRCNITPVVKRRCMCGLAKLIGFSKDAVENYRYINQIGIYKLIDPSHSIQKGKLITSMENTTRLKLPFSNMICNIHQDTANGSYQVFSQGTADIILDACVEFWDGHQLVPLDELSRKKAKDFYHRTSLTSYCSAFAYTPLLKGHNLHDKYIELPPENSKFAPHLRRLANEQQEDFLQNQMITLPQQQCKNQSGTGTEIMVDASVKNQVTRRHLSVEDLDEQLDESFREQSTRCSRKGKKDREFHETLNELTDQVFVGMVSMQYQACPDFVALVEQLEHACIRFVHFSKENELRSRVFSEKMGLESGWNCHISLQSDKELSEMEKREAKPDRRAQQMFPSEEDANDKSTFSPTTRISNILIGSNKPTKANQDFDTCGRSISSDERTLYSWKSLPSLVMKLSTKLNTSVNHHNMISTPDHSHLRAQNKAGVQLNYPSDSSNYNLVTESECGDEMAGDQVDEESTKEEGFDTLAFDMSNRAKLPKGIENIRPHLETVDNVPLQVSLFTDCTPELTREMIEIMQEYGEIVCVIGSSSSKSNTPVFLQANASIAVEPLMPQSCTRSDDKHQRTLERKERRYKKRQDKINREPKEKKKKKKRKKKEPETPEFTAINMNPRPANPRDRLGIGPTDSGKPLRTKPQPPSSSSSSSSSSSASSASSSAFSSPSSSSGPSLASSCSSSPNNSDVDEEDVELNEKVQKRSKRLMKQFPAPSALASKLASLPCSYSYNRKEQVNLYNLIMEARHFTFKMKNTFVCMICFALSISSAQFLASILFLPPMLSSGLTIWLTVVVVPLMSFSLMSTTIDSQVMKIAVGKNLQLQPENITFFVICYLIKFIPSIFVVVLSFGLIIAHSCKLTGFGSSSLGPCWMFTYVQHGRNATSSDTGDEDLTWSSHLLTAQVCAAFLLVLYFVVISAGFVHRSHLMWQRSPTRNGFWVFTSLALIVGQLLYNQLVLQVNLSSSKISHEFLASLPLHIWVISFVAPILVIGINLLVKRAEIKATIRQQRRARFDFNTKLGMNSPF